MSTPDLVRSLAPAYAALTDDQIQPFLNLAIKAHTASQWGNVYPEAMAWYAAHLLATGGDPVEAAAGGGGAVAGGPLTSQKDGDLARGYGGQAAGYGGSKDASVLDLSQTSYGRHYLTLRRSRAASAPRVVRVV